MQRPPGVTLKNGRWYLVRRNKWTGLTRESEGDAALWQAYYRLTKERPTAMVGLLLRFIDEGMAELRPPTQASYRLAILSRLLPWCGHMPLGTLTAGHVAQYLEARKKAGAAVGGNRERAALSSACAWGMRHGLLPANPCHGVRRNRERPSRRYVEHHELEAALNRASPALYLLMSATYLTGLRQTDVVQLRRADVAEDGLLVVESKTGKVITKLWTPVLRQVVADALARSKCEHVFTNAHGQPWTVWAVQSAMRRLAPGFRLRDLRPKAETDAPGTLGHTGQMAARYTRRERLRAVH